MATAATAAKGRLYVLYLNVRSDNKVVGKEFVLCEFDLDNILLKTQGTGALCDDAGEAHKVCGITDTLL